MSKQEKSNKRSDNLLSSKKQWRFRLIVVILPFVLWLTIELFLNFIIEKEKPFRLVEKNRNQQHLINQSYFNQFFLYQLPEMNNLPVSNNWLSHPKGKTFRVFCLGGSTTLGYPYNQFLDYGCPVSFSRFLESMLNEQNLSDQVQIANLGCNALSSREVRRVMKDVLDYHPDIFVIYTGHNEFFGPNEFAISRSKQALLTHQWIANLFDFLRRTWLFKGMKKILLHLVSFSKKPRLDFKEWSEKNYIPFDPGLEKRLRGNFRNNLINIVKIAQQNEVPVYLCTVVSNWLFPPFMSIHSRKVDAGKIAKWDFLFQEGKKYLLQKNWEKALHFFIQAERIDSLYADLYFQKAKVYRRLGRTDHVISSLKMAIDLDALPFRARSWVNPTIRSVGKKLGIPIIELEKQFISLSNAEIPDPNFLLEHLHPNVVGYYKLAQFIAHDILDNYFQTITGEPIFHPLESYLKTYGIHKLSIDKIEYDIYRIGNYLERLSLFNPEVREFIINISKRAYEDAVKIKGEYLNKNGKIW